MNFPYVKVFESYRPRQTDRQDRKYIRRRLAGGQNNGVWSSIGTYLHIRCQRSACRRLWG